MAEITTGAMVNLHNSVSHLMVTTDWYLMTYLVLQVLSETFSLPSAHVLKA
ncbi:hypothetical protein D3C80_1857490 [compost metagenome]